jgi:DNA polymerase
MIMRREEALSALDWWREAGIDVLVDDLPRDWLKPEPKAEKPRTPESPLSIPRDEAPPGPAAPRIGPVGDPNSDLMLLADHPEQEDIESGALMSGAAGRLLDAMLAAIGRQRASVYLAALSPARPLRGRLDDKEIAELAPQALQLVATAAPRILLLLGDAPTRAILGTSVAEARGRLHGLNHAGVTVNAVATFHPRFLLQQPRHKAAAWSDLRLLLGEIGR